MCALKACACVGPGRGGGGVFVATENTKSTIISKVLDNL
jgi:hypothetical protein